MENAQIGESRLSGATREQAAPRGRAELPWPSFRGFWGLVMLLFYRETLRLLVWARAMNL